MSFRVYSAPMGTPDVSPLGREPMLFKELATVDEALSRARHVDKTGRVPIKINGDDGTSMDRREIAEALRVGQHEQVGGPSVA